METLRLSIENLEPIRTTKASKLEAIFDLRISGLGVIRECRLVRQGHNGNLTVYGPSVRAETGGFPRFVIFEPEAAATITALARELYEATAANG